MAAFVLVFVAVFLKPLLARWTHIVNRGYIFEARNLCSRTILEAISRVVQFVIQGGRLATFSFHFSSLSQWHITNSLS
jgi:hypothetical protein